VAVEDDDERIGEAQSLLTDHHADNVVLHQAALTAGAPEHGPYDAIIIEGGVETLPEALTAQLKEGGRMVVIFMDKALGTVRVGHKLEGAITWRYAFNGTAPVLEGFEKTVDFAL
jgi:protein-L-isoaspartate(D-aspartate) O-methyltransferase